MLRPWQTKLWLKDCDGESIHAKLVNRLTADIQKGRLTPGMMIPGSRSMAQQLGINRKTVQSAYEELEAQGWLVSQARRGTFVSDVLPEQEISIENLRLLDIARETRSAGGLLSELYQDVLSGVEAVFGANDGIPDVRLIPYEVLSRAYRRALIQSVRQRSLGYGDPRGTKELRLAIQRMLKMERFVHVELEQICTVRGSQMGIFIASRVLDPKKGVIVLEELSYPPAQASFESCGFEVVRCRIDEHGLDIEDLQRILAEHQVAGLYTTPHHQYPTTVCMSMERRLKLLSLSRSHRFSIVEDDYDHEFHYESRPIPPLASLPESENVIHIGSLSKVFAPGLRLGYMVADQHFIDRAAQEILLIDRQGNSVTELALAELMDSGEVKKHIRKTRKLYQSRRDFSIQEFLRVFGEDVSFSVPAGGMAIWVNIENLIDERNIEKLKHSDFHTETLFGKEGEKSNHIRFGFGALTEQEISSSIKQLSILLHRN
ncbi:PLP-dependent aminotransferase family protein [Teredinibacter sp. KSP-S5-2]|uniref:MocR-like pyridoxine biosynthesis transcription factor PdxR n=1 Tax=Teredinibacter sp. KSP-S5-2 TaxID=3034506 RepID=UPI0029351871|nr:PLP-dependent aminotransferase family protein [Teredinibacter sp. KSP-S5-2]WNO07592.1 PLP-dependent aminotransferase family protein [Teredinibacter sp. KSP-S5-2]